MKKLELLYSIGSAKDSFIDEASPVNTVRKSRKTWKALLPAAACLALVILAAAGIFRGGIFKGKPETAVLKNGETIIFEKSDVAVPSIAADGIAYSKELSGDDAAAVFGDIPVTAYAHYDAGDNMLGCEGKIGNVRMVMSASGYNLLDTKIVGAESDSVISGVPITAGYFTTKENSNGIKTTVYYSSFETEDYSVYLENGGPEGKSEDVKTELVSITEELIEQLTAIGTPKQVSPTGEKTEFTGILGYDGYRIEIEEAAPSHYMWFYYAEIDGEVKCIGDLFGYPDYAAAYSVDLDGDGKTELICNCMYGADAAQRVYVFRNNNGITERGYIEESLYYDELDGLNYPHGAITSKYDPERSVFIVKNEDTGKSISFTLDDFTFEEYIPPLEAEMALES